MLVDPYDPEGVFARVPQMVGRIDPILNELDQLPDDDEVYQKMRTDFGKRYRLTKVAWATLHPGGSHCAHAHRQAPAWMELIRETEEQVDQNLILRWFCRLSWADVPDDTTLIRLR